MPAYSKATITRYLHRADTARTTRASGQALETLICYLFKRIPGLSIHSRNTLNIFASEEIDIAFWNDQFDKGLKSFNDLFFVECKNWSKPVGSMEVSWFISKIENRGLDFGILVAANGITGDSPEKTAAHDIVAKALARGIRVIVLKRDEIVALKSSDHLVKLIKMSLQSNLR